MTGKTQRAALAELLRGGEWSLRALAREMGRPMREVEDDLAHLRRSFGKQAFRTTPARCGSCDFRFGKRTRLRAPSRCPRCRSELIEPATIRLLPRDDSAH